MNITIIGYGNVGGALTKQLRLAGHTVTVTGRNADRAATVAAAHGAAYAPLASAAKEAEVVILAVPYGEAQSALAAVGSLEGKVLVDVTNPLTADYMGLTLGHDTSAAEQIAQMVPGVPVVKAFNTLFAQVIDRGAEFNGARTSAFFAGDDAAAKAKVRTLVESLGYAPVDAGGLNNARYLEPLAGLNIYLGYGAGLGTQIAPTWLSR
jgi:8-hydroxy-5-deazaflavin:NADPH oxidoreductase